MKKRFYIGLIVLLFLFGGCEMKFQSNYNQEYVDWVDKFFDFNFTGNESIEMEFYRINDYYAAKIQMPKKDLELFLGDSVEKAADIFSSYDEVSWIISSASNANEAFQDFVVVTEDEFDFALFRLSSATIKDENFGIDCLSRSQYTIVLKPQKGIVTVYAIANLIHSDRD